MGVGVRPRSANLGAPARLALRVSTASLRLLSTVPCVDPGFSWRRLRTYDPLIERIRLEKAFTIMWLWTRSYDSLFDNR